MRGRLSLLGIAVSVLCLGGVVWWAAHQPAPRFPDTAGEWLALAGAVALYGVNTLVRAERWHRLLVQDGGTPQRRDSYALTVIGYTGNNVLPARAGDAVRVVLMAPLAQVSRRTVVGTLLAERILDVVWVLVLFVVVGYGILGEVSSGRLELIAVVTVAGLVALAVVVGVLRRNQRARELIGPMLTSTVQLVSAHGAGLVAMTGLIWLLETLVWMTVGLAAGFGMTLIEGLYLVALASVFSLIPSGPAYAGTQDTATIVGIRAIGGTGATAVSYLLLIRFVLQVPITIAGFVLLAARYGGIRRLRRAPLGDDVPTPATSR